jgi:hypothetical protein
VVEIDLEIAVGFDDEIGEAVPREEGEHVIEERNLRLNLARPAAVDLEFDVDVGLVRLAVDRGDPGQGAHSAAAALRAFIF